VFDSFYFTCLAESVIEIRVVVLKK